MPTWCPFRLQFYFNGHNWLASKLAENGLSFSLIDNAYDSIENFYEMHRRVLEASEGMIDFTHIDEDLGTQTGQIISVDIFEKHFAPKFKKYFDMVHSYGARAMMHICAVA